MALLYHSKSHGHGRLAVRRYLMARFLGVDVPDDLRSYCVEIASRLRPSEILRMAEEVCGGRVSENLHVIASELLGSAIPNILEYKGHHPSLSAVPRFCGERVTLVGDVRIGPRAWLGPRSVIRADGQSVQISEDFYLGVASTIHIDPNNTPVIVGNRVVVGSNSVLHSCTIGDGSIIENDVVVLDGAVVEPGAVVQAGSTVFPKATLESGKVYRGSPAKPIALIDPDARECNAFEIKKASMVSLFTTGSENSISRIIEDTCFVADTAIISGKVILGDFVSILFGCVLNGSFGEISIGSRSNIQENVVIDTTSGSVQVGFGTTIGHNVQLFSCSIGSRSLIGMGSALSTGTVVDDDVLLAAGSRTEHGQHIYGGWLWGGRPARPLSRLDDVRRRMMNQAAEAYLAYGAIYSAQNTTSRIGSR